MRKLTSFTLVFVLMVMFSGLITAPAAAASIGSEPPDFVFQSNQPTFIASGGANTITGTIGPTPNDTQDPFNVTIPSGFQVTSVSFSGPTGGSFSHNLNGCGLSGTGNLNQTFNPPQTNCQLSYFISTDFATGANSWTVTVNVTSLGDIQDPTWSVPSTINVNTDAGQSTAVVNYTATASDNVGVVSSSCSPTSGSAFSLGSTTVNCTAQDAAGNIGTASFSVVVSDKEKPTWSVPNGISVNTAPGAATAQVTYTATASDNVAVASSSCTPSSGSVFSVGTTTVNCTASDTSGNQAVASFNVTVVDNQSPVIIQPSNITQGTDTNAATAVVTFSSPAAFDNVGIASVVCSPASGSTFALGATTVNCTATDTSGNQAGTSFSVTIQDDEAPVITLSGNATVDVNFGVGYSDEGATASDNVDGDISNQIVVGGDTIDANTPVGSYEITYNVTDNAGNAAVQVARTVNVLSTLANDVNSDGIVSPADVIYVINRLDPGTDLSADVNGDNVVDQNDVDAVITALGTSAE